MTARQRSRLHGITGRLPVVMHGDLLALTFFGLGLRGKLPWTFSRLPRHTMIQVYAACNLPSRLLLLITADLIWRITHQTSLWAGRWYLRCADALVLCPTPLPCAALTLRNRILLTV